MANTLGIDYAADHEEQELDRGQTIKFKGKELAAIVGIPQSMREFEGDGAGYFETLSLDVTIRRSLVRASIQKGDTLTYEGKDYRIENIRSDEDLEIYILTCEGLAL